MKKIYEKDMPLLSRKRIAFEVDHPKSSTPKKALIEDEVAKQLNVDKNLIKVRHIYSKYGACSSKVIAHVYSNEKTKKLLEDKRVKKKKQKQAEVKKE